MACLNCGSLRLSPNCAAWKLSKQKGRAQNIDAKSREINKDVRYPGMTKPDPDFGRKNLIPMLEFVPDTTKFGILVPVGEYQTRFESYSDCGYNVLEIETVCRIQHLTASLIFSNVSFHFFLPFQLY